MGKCYCSYLWKVTAQGNAFFLQETKARKILSPCSFPCWWFLQGVPKGCSLIYIIFNSNEEVQSFLATHVLCWGCHTSRSSSEGSLTFSKHETRLPRSGKSEQWPNFLLQYALPQRKDSCWASLDPQFSPCHNTTIRLLQSKSQLLMVLFHFFIISFFPLGRFLVTEIFQLHLTVTQME